MASRVINIVIVVVVVLLIGVIICNWPVTITRGPHPMKESVVAFRYDRNIDTGDTITDEDLIRVEIPKDFAESIGRLLDEELKGTLAVGRKINRDVSKDDFAMIGHFTTGHPGMEYGTGEDMVQIAVQIDWKPACTRLRLGNHVNILGMLPTKTGSYKTYRIIEWLKVVAIGGWTTRTAGGQDPSGDSSNTAKRGPRTYKTITVEMRRNVALKWRNLQTYMKGPASFEICPAKQSPKKGACGKIADELLPFTTKRATAPTTRPRT